MRIGELNSGYAIVLYKNYNRMLKKTKAIRIIEDYDEAIYNANSLSKCDHDLYCVYDCSNQKLIH